MIIIPPNRINRKILYYIISLKTRFLKLTGYLIFKILELKLLFVNPIIVHFITSVVKRLVNDEML